VREKDQASTSKHQTNITLQNSKRQRKAGNCLRQEHYGAAGEEEEPGGVKNFDLKRNFS
jgi:hypothetical protein